MGTSTSKTRRQPDTDRETLLSRPYRRDDYPNYDSGSRWRSTLVQGAVCAALIAGIIVGTGSLAVPYAQSHFSHNRGAPSGLSHTLPHRSNSDTKQSPGSVTSGHLQPTAPVLSFEPAGVDPLIDGVAVAAACQNRHDSLRKALPTWLALRGLTEIVLIDWSSKPALSSLVKSVMHAHAVPGSPHVRVVRVEHESEWVLSRAYNLAMNQTRRTRVLKLDCDYQVRPPLLARHKIARSSNFFYTGYYMNSRDENEIHLNGALLVSRAHFRAIGGYDERIQKYGYDDEDLYNRLMKLGLERRNISYDVISHIRHHDAARAQTGVAFPRVQIEFNKMLVEVAPEHWTRAMNMSQYTSTTGSSTDAGPTLVASFVPPSIQMLFNESFRQEKWRIALGARLSSGYRVPWAVVADLETASLETLLRNLMRREDALKADEVQDGGVIPRLLIAHVQNGLGNRLRALGSALDFAAKTQRELVVIWEQDEHLQAPISAVLNASRLPFVVMDRASQMKWPLAGLVKYDSSWAQFDLYNYMSPDGKRAQIVQNASRHIYFKSAFAMQSKLTSWESENAQLKHLPIRDDVLALVHNTLATQPSAFGGVHVRNRSLSEDIDNVQDLEKEYGKKDVAELEKWRSLTSYKAFVAEMQRVLESGEVKKMFVATDTIAVVPKLEKLIGADKLFYIDRSCDDRSSACVKYAMADILVLSKSKVRLVTIAFGARLRE